jgi:hypothetical protein
MRVIHTGIEVGHDHRSRAGCDRPRFGCLDFLESP